MLSKKIKIIFFVLLLSSAISFNSSLGAIAFLSPNSVNEVTIDGKWTAANEWEDAIEFPIKFGFTHYIFGYFLIKDTEEFLYVLIDHTPDVTLEDGDSGKIRLDINNDGSNSPQTDDYIISLDWSGNMTNISIQQGNGTEWIILNNNPDGIEATSSNNIENNPYSKNQHLIYEFAIPRNILGNESVIGFSATSIDWSVERSRALERSETTRPRYISFPDGAHYRKPSTWAKLQFSTTFKEESKSELTSNPGQDSIPVPTSAPSPKPTQKSTPEPATKPEHSIKENPREPQEESFITKGSGGNLILVGIIILVMIILTAIFLIKRKK